MSKFKRVLSGDDCFKLYENYDGNLDDTIYDVEQAVLAKLAEQEAVTYIILDKNGFEFDLVPSTKDYELKEGESFIPLYARPCVSSVSVNQACDSQNEKYETQTPEGWQLVPTEPTEEMLATTSWPNCAGTDYKHMVAAAPKYDGGSHD